MRKYDVSVAVEVILPDGGKHVLPFSFSVDGDTLRIADKFALEVAGRIGTAVKVVSIKESGVVRTATKSPALTFYGYRFEEGEIRDVIVYDIDRKLDIRTRENTIPFDLWSTRGNFQDWQDYEFAKIDLFRSLGIEYKTT